MSKLNETRDRKTEIGMANDQILMTNQFPIPHWDTIFLSAPCLKPLSVLESGCDFAFHSREFDSGRLGSVATGAVWPKSQLAITGKPRSAGMW